MALCRYNPRHNVARQLRPYVLWSVLPDKGAWLRYWRLERWWRPCPEKDKGPTPLERLSKFRPPGPATLNSTWTVSHEKQATRENQGSTLPPNAGPLARDEPQTTAGKEAENSER